MSEIVVTFSARNVIQTRRVLTGRRSLNESLQYIRQCTFERQVQVLGVFKTNCACSAHAALFVAKYAHLISPQICGLTLDFLKCPLIYRLAVVLIQGAAIRSWWHMVKTAGTLWSAPKTLTHRMSHDRQRVSILTGVILFVINHLLWFSALELRSDTSTCFAKWFMWKSSVYVHSVKHTMHISA